MNVSSERFKNPRWMGYPRDGRGWVPFPRYPFHQAFIQNVVTHTVVLGDEAPKNIESFDRNSVAFYQSWLTFGFLEAVFEEMVPENLLLGLDQENNVVMAFEHISTIVRIWAVNVFDFRKGGGDVRRRLDRAAAAQREAHNKLFSLLGLDRFHYPNSDYIEIVRLSNYIAGLGEAIQITTSGLFYKFLGSSSIPSTLGWDTFPALCDYALPQAVIADGWCLSMVDYLIQTTNLATLRLAFTTGPFRREQHRDCSRQNCTADDVNVDNYVVQHTSPGCQCRFSRPNIGHLTDLLHRSSVPVVALTASCDNDEALIQVQDGSQTPYVAISHVWAHGLGSSSEVGLPSCQIKRLAGLASKLIGSGAFWIDALCVPEARETRNLSIGMMADIYRRAQRVLVLDNGILDGHSTASREEKLLRVHLSSWMRRLWTLQEAVLAAKLFFKFSDTFVPTHDLIPSFEEQFVDPVLTGLGRSVITLSSTVGEEMFTITDVIRAMNWRSTSKPEDETIAISSLLNIDALSLANINPSERMKAFYLTFCNLPKSIIFLSMPKLQDQGFRWAPSTFLYPIGQRMARHEITGTCTCEGFTAEYITLRFDQVRVEQEESVCLVSSDRNEPYLLYRVSEAYCCNALLLRKELGLGDSGVAVAVLCKTPSSSDGDDTPVACIFQRQVMVMRLYPTKSAQNLRSAMGAFSE